MRILLVEDHGALSDLVADHLSRTGFAVDQVHCCGDAVHALEMVDYDMLLLDLGLPDGDGMDVLAALRAAQPRQAVPVLILTARDDLGSRLKGLNGGADDYLVKPFDLLELEARLRAILRRPGTRKSMVIQFGDVSYDVTTREVLANGTRLDLAKKEFALLEELMRAAPRIVVKDMLEDRLYAFHEPVTVNAIEAIVYRLRKKMTMAQAKVRIETVRGLGYRMVQGAGDATLL